MLRKLKNATLVVSAVFLSFVILAACSQNHEQNQKEESAVVHTDHQMQTTSSKAGDDAETVAWNKVCPVTGEEVSSDAPTVTYKDKAYGFCCPGCDKKFKDDPEGYAKNLSTDGTEFIGKKS